MHTTLLTQCTFPVGHLHKGYSFINAFKLTVCITINYIPNIKKLVLSENTHLEGTL